MAEDSNIPSTHPLTPPLTEEEWLDWLRLLRSRRVGISTFYRLMRDFGSARAALEALPGIAKAAGVHNYAPFSRSEAESELEAGFRVGARLLAVRSEGYPAGLTELSEAPPLLWIRGDPAHLTAPSVALVGARAASSLGIRITRAIASGLGAAGLTVISGMARGIDTVAHTATIDTGTVAVLAGGVDVVYPPENAVLCQEIAEKGLLLSEQPMHQAPQARHFALRNRIIAGLSRAIVVVEAAARSGSLITARAALDIGRDVLAVPGHPFDARSSGSNMIIRDGATLVRGPEDVIEAVSSLTGELGPPEQGPFAALEERKDPAPSAQALHAEILGRLAPAPLTEDALIRALDAPSDAVGAEIVALELDGRIRRDRAGILSLV